MTQVPERSRLSVAEKDALILALTERLATAQATIAAQEARIAGLEARLAQLTRPPKTPDNSSKPPSQGQKPDRAKPADQPPPRRSRPGVGRTLHPVPDRVVDATLTHCPTFGRSIAALVVYLHYAHAIGNGSSSARARCCM